MQRTMMAAVHATEERLIAPWYMMQISVHLAFYYTERELFTSKALVATYWMHLRVNLICIYFLAHKNTIMLSCSLRRISMATSPYLMFINDVTLTSSS